MGQRIEGVVKSHSKQHGYGFLVDDVGEMYFFHNTQWNVPIPPCQGLRVEFEPVITEKGSRAINIGRIYRRKGETKNGKERTGSN